MKKDDCFHASKVSGWSIYKVYGHFTIKEEWLHQPFASIKSDDLYIGTLIVILKWWWHACLLSYDRLGAIAMSDYAKIGTFTCEKSQCCKVPFQGDMQQM